MTENETRARERLHPHSEPGGSEDRPTDEQWRAIVANDASRDGQFFYAVRTTGIFCRPSCKSRPPKRENVLLFGGATQAKAAGFRPCKRCRPAGLRLPDEEWAALAAAYIDRNYMQALTLERLAEASHGSPYHLHRTFRRVLGATPGEYLRNVRIGRARELLEESDLAVTEIGAAVGLPGLSYFITLFKKTTGMTPAAYRERHRRADRAKEVFGHGEPSS